MHLFAPLIDLCRLLYYTFVNERRKK